MGLLDKFFDKKNGLDARYYRNGQRKGKATFKNGKLEGLSTYWDEEGHVTKAEIYKNGELIT